MNGQTYLIDVFVFGADDSANIIAHALIANVVTFKEIPGDHLGDLFLSLGGEVILFDIELHNAIVSLQAAFEGGCIALVDLVRGDVQLSDRLVVAEIL